MRNYGRVDAAGRLWSEVFLELVTGELFRELRAQRVEMTEVVGAQWVPD